MAHCEVEERAALRGLMGHAHYPLAQRTVSGGATRNGQWAERIAHAGSGADPPSSIPVLPVRDARSNSKPLPPRARYCRSYTVT